MEERDVFNYTPKDVSTFSTIRIGLLFTQILLVGCGSRNPLGIPYLCEVVTMIMEYEIQSFFTIRPQGMFSRKYNPQVFFQRVLSLPKECNIIFFNLITHTKESGS